MTLTLGNDGDEVTLESAARLRYVAGSRGGCDSYPEVTV